MVQIFWTFLHELPKCARRDLHEVAAAQGRYFTTKQAAAVGYPAQHVSEWPS